jgi:1,5-anhydro-D-fructose reductase (1,5-anhydro-D-mannitol-forming)
MLAAIREQPPVAGTRDVAGAWVTALYSHNERRAREFAGRHAIIHAAAEIEPLLGRAEVQCVYVGNHPRHHAETVQAALASHKHVLCEPPLGLTLAEAEPLVRMARNRGLVLALNYTWRAAPAMQRLAELLLADSIGEPLGGSIRNTAYLRPEQQTWRLQPNGGGVVWDRTLHDLDLLHFLLHLRVREVFGRSGRSTVAAAVEDDLLGHVLLTGGLAVQLHDSFVLPHAPATVELYGTRGTLLASACAPADAAPQLLLRRGEDVQQILTPAINPYRASVANFLAAVRGAAPPLVGGEEELLNLAAATAMHRSLREGTVVRCQPPAAP